MKRTLVLAALFAAAGCAQTPIVHSDGSQLVGQAAPSWGRLTWVGRKDRLRLKDLRGKIIVLHWWTDGCVPCIQTLGYLNQLQDKYQPRGLVVVGMYYPDPVRIVQEDNIQEVTTILGLHFQVAIDDDWSVLRDYWLDHVQGQPNAVTFVIDGRGIVRAIHPGESYTEQEASRLDDMVQRLLAEASRGDSRG